jgi:ribosomal protein S12 methylthiotransferase accessory factor
VTWRSDGGDIDGAVGFVSKPRRSSALSASSLGELGGLDDAGAQVSAPVTLHQLVGETLVGCARIPHRYIHFAVATAEDGTFGEGSSTEPHLAMETSLCEAMERFLGTRCDLESLTYGTYVDLAPEAVDPRDFVLPTRSEYERTGNAYVRYVEDLALHWCSGYQIAGGKLLPRLLPATLAVLKFSMEHREERFAPSLSPGTASGPGYVEALLHGTYELVERDAFMLAWLNRRAGPRLEIAELRDAQLTSSLRRLHADGFRATFVDLTTELGIPVVLAAVGRDAESYLSFGLGANVDPWSALERAYMEALEIMLSFYDFGDPTMIRVKNLDVPGRELDLDAYFRDCRFLLDSAVRRTLPPADAVSPRDHRRELERCLAALEEGSIDVYFVDLTPPELMGARYRLVRVLASRLQPHLYEWDCWRLDNPRLTPEEQALNLVPNPFAVLDHVHAAPP